MDDDKYLYSKNTQKVLISIYNNDISNNWNEIPSHLITTNNRKTGVNVVTLVNKF